MLKGLESTLERAGLLIPAEAYVSLMILLSLIIMSAAALNAFILTSVFTGNTVFSIVMGLIVGFVAVLMVFALLYLYPSTVAAKKKRAIEEGLPFTLSFMSILSSAGVSPRRMFKTIAFLEQERQSGLGGEGHLIYRDMEILGEDMVSVLRESARRKVSPLFSGVLEGLISTIKSGGTLAGYLTEEARSLMRLRRSIMKELIDTLVIISEIYMAALVAFPLIMIVMLVVMSSIGGGDIGGSSPNTIVPLIIYLLVPGAGLGLLLMLDTTSSR